MMQLIYILDVRIDTKRIQSGYKVDTEWIQSGYKVVTKWIQSGYRVDTEWIQFHPARYSTTIPHF